MKLLSRLCAAGAAAAMTISNIVTANAQAQSSQSSLPDINAGISHAITTPTDSPIYGYDPFYDDPVPADELGAPGTLLRTQPAPHLLNILGPDFPGYAEKILYTSTTVDGTPVATSGMVIQPANPWTGPGPVPTVVFAPGTRGNADSCAPSRGPWLTGQLSTQDGALGVNYELQNFEIASLLGMRVVVTDYIGLGTPGQHTYVLHNEEAHAVIDAARAVVPEGDPVGFAGYSQGGGAAAAAAELQPTYAPELNLKGTYAGAPPADLLATLNGVDNSLITAVLGYALNGWAERYPEIKQFALDSFNQRGHQFLDDTSSSCLLDGIAHWAMVDSRSLTKSGKSLGELVAESPEISKPFIDEKLGNTAPTTPIMVATGGSDDLVPSSQVKQLAHDYCSAGAVVSYTDEKIPALTPGSKTALNHIVSFLSETPTSLSWLSDRFWDVPAQTNCGSF